MSNWFSPARWLRILLAALAAIPLVFLPGPNGGSSIAALTPQQLAGQRIIYSYPGLTPPAGLLAKIKAGQAAGVIFFGENISSSAQIAAVAAQLKQAAAQSPVHLPLLLMTDQEGGKVRRLPGEPVNSEKTIGSSADPAGEAAQAGTSAGQNLTGAGMDINLAPVLDVFTQPGNFIDRFQRSYSSNPTVVAAAGSAFVTAQQKLSVVATAKHFPGLGSAATAQDTDAAPVTLNASLATLRSVDEAPYPAAIKAGVKMVMTSWATYPALDASHPAGLSLTVIQNELRGRLGFGGVTITDALEAGALQAFGDTSQRAVTAAGAGMDLLLCSARDVSQGDAASAALVSALQSGKLGTDAFTAAVNRTWDLRNHL
ncbi:MAG: glycosyl hydrolase [Amycolatopsis sp.]|uniref:glycoside hydrolase family 3 N-terminal domain-containing protein n=1 Tax=Amycolatopsis sp. TaxID=37632 RepID=UPI002609B8A3|nr:glycoside hydrolase family 3 N-terminal domain-containing protein [Amycolatopsis sp.]MCU1685284.1 glycosyl hydrolase [Amycolatopsis sp.]